LQETLIINFYFCGDLQLMTSYACLGYEFMVQLMEHLILLSMPKQLEIKMLKPFFSIFGIGDKI
jgi:hypothetical protein